MALIDDLVAYWSLDEASGDALDAHGSNDLTDNNTVGAATGLVSGARDFERDNSESFSISDNADLSFGDEDFEFAGWIYIESFASFHMLWTKGIPEYSIYIHGGEQKLHWDVQSLVEVIHPTVLSTGAWYFVTTFHDATSNLLGITINGGAATTVSYSSGGVDGSGTFELGGRSGNQFFDGLMDEVGCWRRLLTSDERTELYNSGDGRDYAYISGGGSPIDVTPYRIQLVAGTQVLSGGIS